jgi:MFS-type transporter involved in bile tolerance (Atg22 family)
MSSSQKKEKSDSTDQVTTTNSELNSWYLYEAAAAAFTIVALTQLLPAFMNGMAANNEGDDHLVYIGIVGQRNRGFEYTWLLVPFVVVLQIFFLLLCGPLGDLNSLRKPLFILNLVLGAIGLMLFVVVDDSFFAFSGVLLVFVSVCSSLAMTFFNAFLVTIARDRADVKEAETKAEAEGQDSNTSAGVLVDRTIRMSVGGVISSFCGAIILTIIVTLITLGFNLPCKNWCSDCPPMRSTTEAPGWANYEYTAINVTVPEYLAWPGINPPCKFIGRDGLCAPGSFDHYVYGPNGARWSNTTNVNDTVQAAIDASKRNDLCTLPSVPTSGSVASCVVDNSNASLLPALCADNGNTGCPYFRCSPRDCPRYYDSTFCDSRHLIYRIPLLITGLWWLLLSIPAMKFFQRRPAIIVENRALIKTNLRRLWLSVRHAYHLKDAIMFLIAHLIHRNAVAMIVLLGPEIIHSAPIFLSGLPLYGVLVLWPLMSVVGMLFYTWLAGALLRWRRKRNPNVYASWGCQVVMVLNLLIMALLMIWAMPQIGPYTRTEVYILSTLGGLQLGSLWAMSRAFFTRLIPRNFESQFFALFEIADKCMVWPIVLIVRSVLGSAIDVRWAVLVIFFAFASSAVVLGLVSAKRAQKDAIVFVHQANQGSFEAINNNSKNI